MDTAIDGLGQDIYVGDKVVWVSERGKYGRGKYGLGLFIVRGITAKRVAITDAEMVKKYPDYVTYAAHDVLIVVNKLINDPSERDE